MRGLARPLLIVCLALLVPILPFLGFGDRLEAKIVGWFDPPPAPTTIALATIGILASDILLPVPSSLVSTIAGAQLGVLGGTVASWIGMTIGASLGFLLARKFGRAAAAQFASADDLARMDELSRRYGSGLVLVTRPLPVLAEAAVLVLGTTQFSWRQFLPAMMLSNLGIALMYALLGQFAETEGQLPLALGASIALPLLATTIARKLLYKSSTKSPPPETSRAEL